MFDFSSIWYALSFFMPTTALGFGGSLVVLFGAFQFLSGRAETTRNLFYILERLFTALRVIMGEDRWRLFLRTFVIGAAFTIQLWILGSIGMVHELAYWTDICRP